MQLPHPQIMALVNRPMLVLACVTVAGVSAVASFISCRKNMEHRFASPKSISARDASRA